jgi:hypothetical protein
MLSQCDGHGSHFPIAQDVQFDLLAWFSVLDVRLKLIECGDGGAVNGSNNVPFNMPLT